MDQSVLRETLTNQPFNPKNRESPLQLTILECIDENKIINNKASNMEIGIKREYILLGRCMAQGKTSHGLQKVKKGEKWSLLNQLYKFIDYFKQNKEKWFFHQSNDKELKNQYQKVKEDMVKKSFFVSDKRDKSRCNGVKNG